MVYSIPYTKRSISSSKSFIDPLRYHYQLPGTFDCTRNTIIIYLWKGDDYINQGFTLGSKMQRGNNRLFMSAQLKLDAGLCERARRG
jgi:hypothetical protein